MTYLFYIYTNFPIIYKFLQKHRNLKKFKEQKIEKNFLSAKKKKFGIQKVTWCGCSLTLPYCNKNVSKNKERKKRNQWVIYFYY